MNFFICKENRWSYLLILSVYLASCTGAIWPSRGMTVDLNRTGSSAMSVEKVVEGLLLDRGFKDMGKDGRDEIKDQRSAFYFKGPNDIQVFIEVDQEHIVSIRVNQDHKTFSSEANFLFDELADTLEARWPSSVARESAPTK